MRANGTYTMTGFTQEPGRRDGRHVLRRVARSSTTRRSTTSGLSKRGYWLDTSKIMLMCMEDEWMHKHTPARPHNQFLMYRSSRRPAS